MAPLAPSARPCPLDALSLASRTASSRRLQSVAANALEAVARALKRLGIRRLLQRGGFSAKVTVPTVGTVDVKLSASLLPPKKTRRSRPAPSARRPRGPSGRPETSDCLLTAARLLTQPDFTLGQEQRPEGSIAQESFPIEMSQLSAVRIDVNYGLSSAILR
jgi:hypothetical protein